MRVQSRSRAAAGFGLLDAGDPFCAFEALGEGEVGEGHGVESSGWRGSGSARAVSEEIPFIPGLRIETHSTSLRAGSGHPATLDGEASITPKSDTSLEDATRQPARWLGRIESPTRTIEQAEL